ncbi:DUF3826 domain-containing protein [Anditalea andensis]|uniref:DUF3826 domain-containing protein n=1 Tax=Anditalea andensis TaxID=1048983 RepID=A0A074L196_9BACT|nr:DUF3826 domain-containing protein [Anditalea andensis]KEO74255.1 hypothetical protein EL17_08975 [Anditalea andensis]
MKKTQVCYLASLFLLLSFGVTVAQDFDPEYIKVTNDRARKIVENINIGDQEKEEKVKGYVAAQYRNLSLIHDERDQRIKDAKEKYSGDKREKHISRIEKEADKKLKKLHKQYLAQLSSELSDHQVDQVKDGMTYGVAPNTFKVYQEMVPTLTEEQKEKIWMWLVEARENAMDAGTSKDKHAWFGKYKGRINNYLSSLGIDMKEAEKEMYSRQARQ